MAIVCRPDRERTAPFSSQEKLMDGSISTALINNSIAFSCRPELKSISPCAIRDSAVTSDEWKGDVG